MSRLIHSDYFDNIIPMQMKSFKPKIDEHREKCMHPKCIGFNKNNQCETMFDDYQCQGVKGHEGCCQDIGYECVEGEQYTYYNGKNWCKLNG